MIEIADLTGGEVQGAGMFDELMRTTKAHLQLEFSEGRITGVEYANAYLSAMTSSLGTASQFILQYELANQQLLLAQEQIDQTKQQTALVTAQIAKMEADTDISVKQLTIMDEQLAQMVQQTALTVKQIDKADADILIATKQLLVMDAQIAQVTSQTRISDQQLINTTNENTTITKGQNKLDAEIGILNQKQLTEEAQIKDVVNGANVEGILGKQSALYGKQADGYTRDSEQKAAKILIDTWTVQRSTNELLDPYPSFTNTKIEPVIQKLIAGVA